MPIITAFPGCSGRCDGGKDLLRRVRDRCSDDAQGTHTLHVQNIVVNHCESLWAAFYAGMVKYLHLPETANTDTLEKYDSTER